MTYEEALSYIHSVNWTFCRPGLSRIRTLCQALGEPQRGLRFVHVAGTNGKGSFCSMLDSVLRCAGYHTGRFTSPYVRSFEERICVDGEPIPRQALIELTERIRPIADAMADKPTEFELITAMGFVYFAEQGVDAVILEVGLGGALDSTNIIEAPELSVITGIAMDHTALLGSTVLEIAAQKAGIIKHGCPVLYGGADADAEAVIKKTAWEREAPYHATQRQALHVREATLEGTCFDYRDREALRIGLLGDYQPYNAANVLEAVDILRTRGFAISEEALRQGLREARWPARFEVISHDPLTVYDGAHNPEGISAAVRSIRRYFGDTKVYILTGVMRDKDYADIARDLVSVVSRAFTVTPSNPRALSAEAYAETLSQAGINATAYESLSAGLRAAMDAARADGVPLICLGSLYMYSELMDALGHIV